MGRKTVVKERDVKVALRLALPNGSLEKKTLELFAEADLAITVSPRRYTGTVRDSMIEEVVFMRPQNIPWAVEQGKFDVGVCGSDCVSESGSKVVKVAILSYSRVTDGSTRIVLMAPADDPCKKGENIPNGSVILSEYPNLTARWMEKLGKNRITILRSYGSTEAMVPLLAPYGVCLTETGASLVANNLKVVDVLMESNTVVIANKLVARSNLKADTIKNLRRVLLGALAARQYTMLVMNVEEKRKAAVLRCLPALKQPTIAPLYGGGYVSISTVAKKAQVNDLVAKILKLGAKDVVAIPITRMIRSLD